MKFDLNIDHLVEQAVREACPDDAPLARSVERFLRTGRTPKRFQIPAGDFTRWAAKAQAHDACCQEALLRLFTLLSGLISPAAQKAPGMSPEQIRKRVRPMVEGLLQPEWRDTALRELGSRIFVLNPAGARAAIRAEFSTTWTGNAWDVFWLYFDDYGLALKGRKKEMDGVTAGSYAHIRLSTLKRDDCDVIVHEAAHLLHYLKPANFGLRTKRGQTRFVDVAMSHRELFAYACEAFTQVAHLNRKARMAYAERMRKEAVGSRVRGSRRIAELVMAAARARNGWKVIREATVLRWDRSGRVEIPPMADPKAGALP